MSDRPDFDVLRAERNAKVEAELQKVAASYRGLLWTTFDPNACYCACATGGPCEHTWDGPGYESEDGCMWTATCSRCGCTAMSHSLRTAP